jgi:hypothetical protein
MLEEQKGSPNGIRVEKYLAGKSYEMPEHLANIFIDMGAAKPVKEERTRKSIVDAPRNKAVTPEVIPAPEVKNDTDAMPLKEKPGRKKNSNKAKPARRSY